MGFLASARSEECKRTIGFTGIIFVIFYGSLIGVIIYMYCRYKRELREMAKDQSTNVNFRLVKRLMAHYDQKETTRQVSAPYGQSRASGLIIKDIDISKDNPYNKPIKRKSRSGYVKKNSTPL